MKSTHLLLLASLLLAAPSRAAVRCSDYPHWDCTDPDLARLDDFLKANRGRGRIAAVDWDGTLYEEKIPLRPGDPHAGETRSGQSAWHLWGAGRGFFPLFASADGEHARNVVRRDDYLEGKTSAELGEYSKYSQIAVFEAGMTPREMVAGVRRFLEDYPVEDFAYPRALDVVGQLRRNGFRVWIVTGSNPYFVITLAKEVERRLGVAILPEDCDPEEPDLAACQIIGNGAKLGTDGKFTLAYDDRFVRLGDPGEEPLRERTVVDGAGKVVAMRQTIEEPSGQRVLFYAGNSGGDYHAIRHVLGQGRRAMALAINPRGTLLDLVSLWDDRDPTGQRGRLVTTRAEPGAATR